MIKKTPRLLSKCNVSFPVPLNILPVLIEDPSRGQVLSLLSSVDAAYTQTFCIYNLCTQVYIENVAEIIVIRIIIMVISFISFYNCKAVICVLGFA